MTEVSGAQGGSKPRIVTNVSGQRFATSSSGSGTTITFGRAPPNVTVSSSLTPPPLTRISDTVESITAELNAGVSALSSRPTPSPKLTGFTRAPSSYVNSSRGPPNVVVSSVAQVMTASGVASQVAKTSHFTSSSNNPVGVIRAPIVIPPQVKQETPPPPPLLHASKVPGDVRILGGPGTVVSSAKVSIAPSSFSQVRSFSQKAFPSPNGQPLYKLASNSTSTRTMYINQSGQKHIMPSYQSFAQQRISPKPPGMGQRGVTSDSSKIAITRNGSASGFQSFGQAGRPGIVSIERTVIIK